MYATQISVTAAAIFLPSICTLFVGLRIYARRLRKIALGADDILIVLAAALIWGLGAIIVIGASNIGVLGQNIPRPKKDAVIFSMKLAFAYDDIERPTLGLIKLSFMFLYRRIFRGQVFDIISKVIIGFLISWTLIFSCLAIFGCGTHPEAQWGPYGQILAQCLDFSMISVCFAVLDVFSDLLVLSIPIPLIIKLQMPSRKKIGLACIFLIGSISTAAGIWRMVINVQINYLETDVERNLGTSLTELMLCSITEVGLGIIAACLPVTKPLFAHHKPQISFDSWRQKLRPSSYSPEPIRNTSEDCSTISSLQLTPLQRLTYAVSNERMNVHKELPRAPSPNRLLFDGTCSRV